MEFQSSSTPQPRRTQTPGSFFTPSRIPRMKDSTLSKTFSTFAPVNLFSVSAVFSNTTSLTQEGYNFTFVHEGRQQEAVLDQTFLTGLEKDNVRITWEQATRELYRGQEVRVDVTQLKSKSFDQKWLVFGLYFYTIYCLGDPSSGELDGTCPDSSQLNSDVGWANSKEDKLKGENPSSRTLRSAFQTESEDKIDLLEDSPSVQEVESLSSEETNGNVCLVDVDNSDASFSISFGSMSDSGESSEDLSMLVNPDLATSHMEDLSVNEGVELPNEGIYFESLVRRSSIPTDASVIEAQFKKVLEDNELLENYDHLAAVFDQIFEESPSNAKIVISITPLDNTVLYTTNSLEAEPSPVSSLFLGSHPSQDSEKEITGKTGPVMASTPAEKCGDGDHSHSGLGLESTGKFIPVKMDSGYYETFSSGSQLEMSSESDESPNHAEETSTKLPICVTRGVFRQLLFVSFEQIISELVSII